MVAKHVVTSLRNVSVYFYHEVVVLEDFGNGRHTNRRQVERVDRLQLHIDPYGVAVEHFDVTRLFKHVFIAFSLIVIVISEFVVRVFFVF